MTSAVFTVGLPGAGRYALRLDELILSLGQPWGVGTASHGADEETEAHPPGAHRQQGRGASAWTQWSDSQ